LRQICETNFALSLSKGVFTTIDVPGARSTDATGINAEGDIVGTYGKNTGYGFLLSK